MNMNIRNYHARLCEKYVEKFSPADHKALLIAAETNYESGKPEFTLGHVFRLFWHKKREGEINTNI